MSLLSLQKIIYKAVQGQPHVYVNYMNIIFYRQFGATRTSDVRVLRCGHPCSILLDCFRVDC